MCKQAHITTTRIIKSDFLRWKANFSNDVSAGVDVSVLLHSSAVQLSLIRVFAKSARGAIVK